MNLLKTTIINQICYTVLVYKRINKKLNINLSNNEIEVLVKETISNAINIEHIRKNYYVCNYVTNTRLTINANNFRVITADRIKPPSKK
ncbi:MAG: DUF3781 domain-containing protein [Liquorilactobacillus ghanensis]|uniref:DUF3781 domain-containing protein n=1 Tax=Liquorilactobacillus ghanensis TaxID=399370 RepID=UPI0039EB855F